MSHADEAQVELPGGPFFMGRSRTELFATEAEQPLRVVTLSPFQIDRFPVTNRRFRPFLEAEGYADPEHWSSAGWRWICQEREVRAPRSFERAEYADEDQPACGLSWYEAEAFARFEGRRLPTSAEWERAARGLDARPFPWGDALPRAELCNFANGVGRTNPVDSYPKGQSAAGLYDMAGNVNNWVADVYWTDFGAYAEREGLCQDPLLDEALARRLSLNVSAKTDRGGGFLTSFSCFEVLSTTYPLGWDAGSRELWHGFRTAASAPRGPEKP